MIVYFSPKMNINYIWKNKRRNINSYDSNKQWHNQ